MDRNQDSISQGMVITPIAISKVNIVLEKALPSLPNWGNVGSGVRVVAALPIRAIV
jgi:hypothetical protein